MKVFLDANILFSAAKSDGAVRSLVRLLLDRGHEAWADAYVVAEPRRNLASKGPAAVAVLDALLTHLRVSSAVPADEGAAESLAAASCSCCVSESVLTTTWPP